MRQCESILDYCQPAEVPAIPPLSEDDRLSVTSHTLSACDDEREEGEPVEAERVRADTNEGDREDEAVISSVTVNSTHLNRDFPNRNNSGKIEDVASKHACENGQHTTKGDTFWADDTVWADCIKNYFASRETILNIFDTRFPGGHVHLNEMVVHADFVTLDHGIAIAMLRLLMEGDKTNAAITVIQSPWLLAFFDVIGFARLGYFNIAAFSAESEPMYLNLYYWNSEANKVLQQELARQSRFDHARHLNLRFGDIEMP